MISKSPEEASSRHPMLRLSRCNCNNTCGAGSPSYAPFRRGQSFQPLLVAERGLKLAGEDSVNNAFIENAVCLCFITVRGIIGLFEVNFTQASLRNKTFLLLSGRTSGRGPVDSNFKARFYFAKVVAACLFLGSVAAAVICPAVFISSIIINEIPVWQFPVGDSFDAIGQVRSLENS